MRPSFRKMGVNHAVLLVAAFFLAACAAPQLRPTSGAPTAQLDPARLVVVTVANRSGLGLRFAGSTWRGWDMGGGYQIAAEADGATSDLASDYGLQTVDAWPIALLRVHCLVFQIPTGESREALLHRLSADPRVESAQPLNVFGTAAASAGRTAPRELQYSLASMQIAQAHHWAQGRGVRVAIIDTGVDYTHPQLRGRVVEHLDLVGRPHERFEDDRHGTAVAGVIAAASDASGSGILGVAPQAELLALKACWALAPGGAEAACNSFTLARALAAAVELKADVLNLSLSGPPDPLLARLVGEALARGMVVVGALPATGGETSFPAAVKGVIAVRALGPANARRRSVAAPGEDIISTAPKAGYALQSGSSFATAHVSGVAALLREHHPELGAAQVEKLLIESAHAPRTAARAAAQVSGVNACSAVTRSLGGGPCTPTGTLATDVR